MKYFCVESQPNDRYSILGVAISLNIFMPDATLCLVCSDGTLEYVLGFYDFQLNIEKIKLENDLSPAMLIKNVRDCVKSIHDDGQDAFYLSNSIVIINSLQELQTKDYTSPIVCLKRDVNMKSDDALYPMAFVLYRRTENNECFNRLTKYYEAHEQVLNSCHEEHMKLNDINLEGLSEDEINSIRDRKTAAIGPISKVAQGLLNTLVNEDDSILTEFFEPERYIDVAQLFAFENSWKLSEFKVDSDTHIVRNNVKCLFTTTCIDPMSVPPTLRGIIMEVWSKIEAIVCFNDPRIHIVQNITNRIFGHRFVISGPKANLFGQWKREDVPSLEKTIVQIIIKSNYINYNQHITNDYYRTGFSLVYDYKDNSLFKGDMFQSRKTVAMLLNYDTKVLSDLEGKYIYCGLYTPYGLLLERENKELPETRNGEIYHFTDDKLSVYDTEEAYVEYIKSLKNYSKSFITDKTPKSHVVDCLGLGVVPVIDENCRLLEIEDIEGDANAYLDYFNNNLTIDALSRRLIKAHMEYVQAPHEPINNST